MSEQLFSDGSPETCSECGEKVKLDNVGLYGDMGGDTIAIRICPKCLGLSMSKVVYLPLDLPWRHEIAEANEESSPIDGS